jgi:hypothetical protein
MELFERLLSNIDKVDGHWLWKLGKNWSGYGLIVVGHRQRRAHIVSYEEFVGPIPKGLQVLHDPQLCIKTRHCINPAHLYLGNLADNSKDCFTTGGRGRSKLTDENIVTIRLSTKEYVDIAKEYGISEQAVSQIKHKHTWKDVAPKIIGIISPMARITHGNAAGRGSSKLSDQDVLDIRESSLSQSELALKYGLQKQSIAHILKRHTFKNI